MADDHDSVVEFDNAYSKEVVFIVGSTESLLENQDRNQPRSPDSDRSGPMDSGHGHSTSADRDQASQLQGARKANPETSPQPESSSPPRKLRKQSRVELTHEEEEGATSRITQKMEGKDKEATMATKEPEASSSKKSYSKETIMRRYEETEKLFQEDVLGKKPPKQRQPPLIKSKTQPAALVTRQVSKQPSSMPGGGMEHLDLLVKLMEQLSHLKEENTQLRTKCSYLNDTQSLLRMQNRFLRSSSVTGKEMHRWKVKGHHSSQSHKSSIRKKMVEDSEESDSSEMDDLPESRKKPKLHHRSQSVGSIQIERIDLELGAMSSKDTKSPEKSKDGSRFEMFSKSKISSKWERVKKVFSGKPEQGSKVEHSTITAEQLVRANSKHIMVGATSFGQQLQPLPPIPTSKSVDSGMRPKSPEPKEHKQLKMSLSAGDSGHPPPSPSSVQSEPVIPSVITNDEVYEDVNPPEGQSEGGLAPPELEYQASSGMSSYTGDEGEVRVTASREYSSGEEPRSPKFLTVHDSHMMRRRQSSPALSLCDDSEFQNMDLDAKPGSSKLGRSHSFKNSKSDLEAMARDDSYTSIHRKQKSKSSRTAWGRVKDIIHTRKDSLKRRNKRCNSAGDSLPDGSTSDGEFFCFRYDYEDIERWEQETSGSPTLARKGSLRGCDSSSPKTPTPSEREPYYKSPSDSPPATKKELFSGAVSAPSSPPQHVDVVALMSSVSDDFNKKIQEWEDKKRKSIYRENSCMDYEERQRAEASKFSDEFIRKMEEWERMKGLSSRKSRGSGKLSQSPAGANSPEELQDPSSLADLQKHLSESFSKTVMEWHKIKESRIKDSGSPIPEPGPRGIHRSRKQDRSKSRERDRSRSKYEKQRERELQKIEKKEQKIEKEKEKLEVMKKKLENLETMSEAEVKGLTKEFARKLQEWELMKGLRPKDSADEGTSALPSQPSSTSLSQQRYGVHIRSNSAKEHREKTDQGKSDSLKRDRAQSEYGRRERTHSEGKSSTPATPTQPLESSTAEGSTESKLNDRSQRASSVPLLSNTNLVDDSTSIDLNLTSETVHILEESNRRLMEDMQEKDEDVLMLQDEIQQLTERINMMNKEQSRQIEIYKRELWASSRIGRHTIENDLVSASIRELGDTVDQINRQQNQVVAEKDKLKHQLAEEIAARHAAEVKVMERIQQMQQEGKMESSEGLRHFCEFFKKLQEQLAELKLGVTERNRLVYKLHHQLVTQEVQNRLLQTDLQRTHMQVDFLQDSMTKGTLRRVKTFGGIDFIMRGEAQVKCTHRRSGRISRHKRPIMLSRDLLHDIHHAMNLSVEPDWEWLHHLEHYNKLLQGPLSKENEECQTEKLGADVSVQTVMTLCKVPYNVPQPQIPQVTTTVGITRTTLTTLAAHPPLPGSAPSKVVSVKGTQTELRDEPDSKASSRLSMNSSYPSSTLSQASLPPGISSAISSSIVSSSSSSTSSGTSLTSVMRFSPTSAKSPQQISTGHEQPQRTDQRSPHVMRVLQSSQALQNAANIVPGVPGGKAPPKPPRRRMVPRIEPDASSRSTVSATSSNVTKDSKMSSTSRSTTVTDSRTLDNEDMTLTFSVQSIHSSSSPESEPRQKGIPPQSQGSSDTDEVFSDKAQQPPYSPIIRSRYPRKRSETKVSQLPSDSSAVWKATPPRRILRHRKVSTERKPDASKQSDDFMSRSQEQPNLDVPGLGAQSSRSLPCDLRQLKPSTEAQPRVLSDSYAPPARDSLAPPIDNYMNNDYLRGRYRFRYQKELHRLPVQDMISRFESANRFSQAEASLPAAPDISLDGRKSPIQRPIQSPVHKLKTAQELLTEHEQKITTTTPRRSSSANRAESLAAEQQGRMKISSTSSDKENETVMAQHRPAPMPVTNVNVMKHSVHPPISEIPIKPILKDLTNGARVKHVKDALNERPVSENISIIQESEVSKEGGVQRRVDRRSRSASPGTPKLRSVVRSDPGVLLSSMDPNKADQEGPWKVQPGVVTTISPSSMSSSYPPTTPPSSPSSQTSNAEKRFQRLFGKKIHLSGSPSSSPHPSHGEQPPASVPPHPASPKAAASPKSGAISMLCRQALVVNLEQVEAPPDPDDLDGSDSPANRKKGVGKLLDKNWLQKPRKFFKVSKKFKF